MDEGAIVVDSIKPIDFEDITPELARESGFLDVLDLLKGVLPVVGFPVEDLEHVVSEQRGP